MATRLRNWFGGTAAWPGGRRRTSSPAAADDAARRFGSARKEGTHLIDSGIGRRVGVRDRPTARPEGPDAAARRTKYESGQCDADTAVTRSMRVVSGGSGDHRGGSGPSTERIAVAAGPVLLGRGHQPTAAVRLGWSLRILKRRLESARSDLTVRLIRRGFTGPRAWRLAAVEAVGRAGGLKAVSTFTQEGISPGRRHSSDIPVGRPWWENLQAGLTVVIVAGPDWHSGLQPGKTHTQSRRAESRVVRKSRNPLSISSATPSSRSGGPARVEPVAPRGEHESGCFVSRTGGTSVRGNHSWSLGDGHGKGFR